MKKTLLLIGTLMLLSTGAVADGEDRIRDMKISKNIVNNAGSMKVNGIYKNINPTEEGYLSGKEYREAILESTLGALDDTYTVIKNNKEKVDKNELAISYLKNNSATKEEVKVLGAKVDTIDTKINGVSDSLTAKDKAVNARVDAVNTKFEEVSNNLVVKEKAINTRIDETDQRVNSNSGRINEAEIRIVENTATANGNKTAIEETGKRVDQTESSISEIKSDFSKHTLEAKKRDQIQDEHIEKLKDADKKFADADKKFTETDKQLKEKDVKIEANIAKLHNHDSAIYEENVSYAAGTRSNIKAVNNRNRIVLLENARATTEEQTTINTGDIATNKVKTEENKKEIDRNTGQINQALELVDNNSDHIEKNSKRIDGLEKKVDGLESKMNKGLAMAAATSSIVYPHLGKGDLGIGAGIGGYGGSQAIAIGVAMQPTENVRINTNVSTSDTMYGAGIGYKFNIFGS